MTERHTVPITDAKHAKELGEWIGAADVVAHLKTQQHDKLPGFALALAIAESIASERRAGVIASNLRALARAGIDVAQMKSVDLEINGDRYRLAVVLLDLADMAEEAQSDG